MSTLTSLSPTEAAALLKSGQATLVDIREPDERARDMIAGSISLPISRLEAGHVGLEPRGSVIFHCRSGMRTQSQCGRLAPLVDGDAFVLEGGIEAWKKAGLPTSENAKAPLEIMRQVQITAGALVLLGVLSDQVWLSAVIGGGLMFAGISGWCGMAKLLAIMPWNKPQVA
jgi:rhodanese-related sulfurtransferase